MKKISEFLLFLNLGKKILSKKIWAKKIFWKKIFGKKKLRQKILGQKNFWNFFGFSVLVIFNKGFSVLVISKQWCQCFSNF